ncbi:MAG TPA: IclR family transcriptional regulator [Candidatus Binatia bacterium]|nr:IclR family transcriptional regulator [Candidatus Binatia bacterium]
MRKAALLLRLLAQHPGGLGLSEVARLANLHHATAYRLLWTLSAAGLVESGSADRRYRLGFRILELAGVLLDGLEVRQVARPVLPWLASLSGETAHLATLDRDEMVCLDRVDGPHPVTLRTRLGFRLPAHATSVGKAFLAFSAPAVVERVVQSGRLTRYTEYTITSREAFLAHLEQVRRQGYAVDNQEHRLTIRCVGAPIFDHRGQPVAAISIAGPVFRLSVRRIREVAELVREAARKISQALGHAGSGSAPPEAPPRARWPRRRQGRGPGP